MRLKALILVLISLNLIACGQKRDLYLPESSEAVEPVTKEARKSD